MAAGLVQQIIAYIMMSLGAFDTITNMLVFVIWTFYSMSFLAVMIYVKENRTWNDLTKYLYTQSFR